MGLHDGSGTTKVQSNQDQASQAVDPGVDPGTVRGLYGFELDTYYGSLNGVFLATRKQIEMLRGCSFYFGEVLGKHSEVSANKGECKFKLLSEHPAVITEMEKVAEEPSWNTLGGGIAGYNPFDGANYVCDNCGEQVARGPEWQGCRCDVGEVITDWPGQIPPDEDEEEEPC